MQIINRAPSLTGVVIGGTMVRPEPAQVAFFTMGASLRTTWVVRVTLAPPMEGDIPQLTPTLLTQQAVTPAPG